MRSSVGNTPILALERQVKIILYLRVLKIKSSLSFF